VQGKQPASRGKLHRGFSIIAKRMPEELEEQAREAVRLRPRLAVRLER
jgi:hypothetical protein